jgi:hypothetical protein
MAHWHHDICLQELIRELTVRMKRFHSRPSGDSVIDIHVYSSVYVEIGGTASNYRIDFWQHAKHSFCLVESEA